MRDLTEIMRNRTPVISVFQELGDALGECLLYEHLHKDGDPRGRKPVEDVIVIVAHADRSVILRSLPAACPPPAGQVGAATKHALSEAEGNRGPFLCGRGILHPPPADSE